LGTVRATLISFIGRKKYDLWFWKTNPNSRDAACRIGWVNVKWSFAKINNEQDLHARAVEHAMGWYEGAATRVPVDNAENLSWVY
jgi:hypothetical protein